MSTALIHHCSLTLFSRQINELPSSAAYTFLFSFLNWISFAAEGPVFSSGHDLKELTDERDPQYHAEVFQTCSEVSQADGWHCKPENDNYTY